MSASKKPKQAGHYAYAILNPYGDFWTPVTFSSPDGAETYLRAFLGGSTERFTFPRVKVTLRLFPEEAALHPDPIREGGGSDG